MGEPQRIGFGEYLPDLPPLVNPGLSVAKNTRPSQGNSYESISQPANIAGFSAMGERARGAIAGMDAAGNPYNFSGDESNLYAHRTGTDEVSLVSGGYSCKEQFYWEFVVYGSSGRHHVIAVNPGDDPQYFTPGMSEKFARLGNPDLTGTTAPRAKTVGVIGSFIVMGNTYDETFGGDPSAIHWSAVNDPFNWPTPGTGVAYAVQSDRQPLGGDGGSVQRVVSGSEVGSIFQERSIWRVDYRGGDVIFELTRVEPMRGLLVPAIAVPFGRNVFYLSEDGFYVFDYTQSQSIGRDRVDSTFLADLDAQYFDRVSAVADPDRQQIWILYPGSGNVGGAPNKVLIYDWGLNRFSHAEIDAEWVTIATAAGRDLDAAHSTADPDTDGVDGDDADGDPLGSFDARIAQPGALKLGLYSNTHQLQDFSGTSFPGTLETGRREIMPGTRSLVTEAWMLVDGADPTVQSKSISRANAREGTFTKPSGVNDTGFCPLRSDARYHVFRINLPSGFRNALGMDVMAMRTGMR